MLLMTGCVATAATSQVVPAADKVSSRTVSSPTVPSPTVPSPTVEAALARRGQAVLAHDGGAVAATQAPGATAGVRALTSRVAALPLTVWTYVIETSQAGPSGAQRTVTAVLHYRLPADPTDVTARRRIVLAWSGGWRVVSDVPVGAALPWDLGLAHWAAGAQSEVVSVATAVDLRASGDQAAREVSAVWGTRWRRVPVLVAVAGAGELAALTGRTPAGVGDLVALATADRVYVDVAAYLSLDPAGRQVLISHEVTHLATAAGADRASPQWLKEGFADYVGFLQSAIPVGQAAAVLLARVRAQGPPPALPDDAAFGPAAVAGVQAQAYAGAWLLCTLIAWTDGQGALVAVYRATAAGTGSERQDVDAALTRVTGRSLAWWTAAWRQDLTVLAA